MKTFIVLIAVVAAVSANSLNRAAGWGSPANLPNPSIDIELSAASAAAAAGQASASQALIETAAGDINGPAYIQSLNGVLAAVSQGEDVSQVAVADKPSGATSTINLVDVENLAVGEDNLLASLGGSMGASVINEAQSQSSGEGTLAAEASSLNNVSQKKI